MVGTLRSSWKLLTLIIFVLLTMLLAACGSDSANATASGAATTSTPTTANACPNVTIGTISEFQHYGHSNYQHTG